MRFILHEQAYEKPIAAGQLRYERDGQATGAIEMWRLTQAAPGYQVLRVDLDARAAESGHSYLYHLVRQENGRAERLAYRFWGDDLTVAGNLLFAETAVINTRTVHGHTTTEVVEVEPGYGFWFPSSVGLGLLAGFGGGTAVTMQTACDDPDELFALRVVETQIEQGDLAELVVESQTVLARLLTIRWQSQARTIWLNTHAWPLKMAREDGLTAVETGPWYE